MLFFEIYNNVQMHVILHIFLFFQLLCWTEYNFFEYNLIVTLVKV